jgi:signal peptidase
MVSIFGYSGFTVLSGSMQSEIPESALVLTKKIDPNNINIGDDITFIRKDDTTVTHRVINIYENYQDSGQRAFQTKGIENSNPDQEVVYSDNIIGIVKLTVPKLGAALNYISEHSIIIFIVFGIFIIIAIAIKKLLSTLKLCGAETEFLNSI